jgi:hypothetical protein
MSLFGRVRRNVERSASVAVRSSEIPRSFVAFCEDTLRVRLTPGQRVVCAVAFDGREPCQLDGSDRDLARTIFGDVDAIPPEARHVIAAMCGARAGKSYIMGALRLLHMALTVELNLAPGESAAGLIVAPDLRLARQTLRYVIGTVRECPSVAKRIESDTADSVTVRRDDGEAVLVVCLPATRGGSALRGRTLVGAVLDEACFFRDADYAVNDEELFKAVAPRIVPRGQAIIVSTPWAESGLLYDLYTRNYGHPEDAIAVHAPTLVLRDEDHIRALIERERERDPDNAAREFDAVPMAAGTVEFFDPGAIKSCIDEDAPLIIRPPVKDVGGTCGLDTGFRKDPSAAVIVRRNGDKCEVAECVEIRPPPGGRLIPSETIKALIARASYHRCGRAVADQHYIESVREHTKVPLFEAPPGIQGKLLVYTAARRLIHESRVRIPAGQTRLIAQLRQVVSKPTAGGHIVISSPRKGGSHGDLVSAFTLALWGENPEFNASVDKMMATMRSMGLG